MQVHVNLGMRACDVLIADDENLSTRRFSEKTALILLVRRWWLDLIFFLDGGMSFHITGSRLHFDNCTFNGPTVAMKASPPAPPPEPPTVVSDADQPQATEAPPNRAFEKAASVMNQLLVLDVAQHPEATNNRPVSMPNPKAMPADLQARLLAQLDRDRRRQANATPKAASNCVQPPSSFRHAPADDARRPNVANDETDDVERCATDATDWMH